MTSGEPVQPPTFRLNPFAFPSDTNFRFWLLISSVFGSGFFIYTNILTSWVLPRHLLGMSGDLKANCHNLSANELASCIQHNRNILLPWAVGTALVLLAVACLIHWTYPYRMLRRSSLIPFDSPDTEDVAAYVTDLCREVALSRFPILVWNPLNPARTGQAFGSFGRYYVALAGGLIAQFHTDQSAFRAVVLHELAHLKNEDVDKTYFTLAIWQAFVIAALMPFAASRFRAPASETVELGWRVLALTAFVYLTRSAVLRTREFYADVRASVWDGPTGALKSVLAEMPQPRSGGWRALLRLHPLPLERKRILENTYPLFQMKFWDAFGAGIAAGIVFPYAKFLLVYTATYTVESFRSFWLGPAVLIPLAACAVGVQVWRATFAEVMRGEVLPSTLPAGIGLASGLFLGQMLSLTITPTVSSHAIGIAWDMVLLGSVAAFMPWIAAGASTWLEVGLRFRSPRAIYRSGLVVAGLLLAIWYASVSASAEMGTRMLHWGVALIFVFPTYDPLFLVISTGLWAFPLSAWFWRGPASFSKAEWVFLDRPVHPPTFGRQVPLSLGVALKIGALGGLVGSLLAVIALIAERVGPLVNTVRHSEEFGEAYNLAWILVVVLVEAAVSEIVRRRVRGLPAVHGLFAASIAGWLVFLMSVGVRLSFKERITAGSLVATGGMIIGWGTIASLLTMFCSQFLMRVYDLLFHGGWSDNAIERTLDDLFRTSDPRSLSTHFGINLGWLEQGLRFGIAKLQDRKRRRRLALVLGLIMAALMGVLLKRSYTGTDLTSKLEAGKQLLEDGDYDWAIVEYRKALIKQPNNADAHNGLGKALAQKGQLDQAIPEFRKALVLKSNDADVHFNLGFALGRLGKVEEAIVEFREAIRLNPKHADAHNKLGIGLQIQGKHEEANVEFREAIRLDPKYAEPHYHLGNALHGQGKYEEAIGEYREAIRLNPKYVEAHSNLANMLRREGKYEEAIAEYREAIHVNPNYGLAHYNLVDALHSEGKYEEANAELQKVFAFKLSDCDEINDDLGYFLASPGRLDEVMVYINKSLQTKSDEAHALDSVGFALDAQAVSWFRKAADAGNARGMSGLGFMHENGRGGLQQDDGQAVSWYRKAADAGNAHGMANLGRMYEYGRGKLPQDDVQAVSWYRKAADAGNARGMSGLGFMYASGRGGLPKDDAQAVSWYHKAADAGNARGMANLGRMYLYGRGGLPKDEAQALTLFRKAADAGDPLGMANLGATYEIGGGGLPQDDLQALSWYRKAADLGEPAGMANLGDMYANGRGGLPKDNAQAVNWYRKAAALGNTDAEKALRRLGH